MLRIFAEKHHSAKMQSYIKRYFIKKSSNFSLYLQYLTIVS